jgi:hypothetical protein
MVTHNDLVRTGTGDCVVYAWDGVRVTTFNLPPLVWNREAPSAIWYDSPGEIVDFSAAMDTRVIRFGVRFHIKINVPAMKASIAETYIEQLANLQTWSIRNHLNSAACMVCLPHSDNTEIMHFVEVIGNFEYGGVNNKATGHSANFEMIGTELLDDIPIGSQQATQWSGRTIIYNAGDLPYVDQWASRISPWYPGHVVYGDTINNWTIGGGLTYIAERVWTGGSLTKSAALAGAGGGICTYNYSGGINTTITAMIRSRQVGGDASFGVIYRQAGANHMFVECDSVANQIALLAVGGTGLIATWAVARVIPQSWFWVKVVASGTSHKVYCADLVTIATPIGTEITTTTPSAWDFVGQATDATVAATGESGIKTGAGSEMQVAKFNDSAAAYATTDAGYLGYWSARRKLVLPFELP